MPYVYKCTHKETQRFYIGYRCQNTKPSSEDLGSVYKTSSKTVKPNFDEYIPVVLAEFFTKEDAYTFEQQLIFEHLNDPQLINIKCFVNGKPVGEYKHSDLTKQKIGAKSKGRPSVLKGKPRSDETKRKLSESMKKYRAKNIKPPANAEIRQKIRDGLKKNWENAPEAICPFCGWIGKDRGKSVGSLYWHLKRCKHTPVARTISLN